MDIYDVISLFNLAMIVRIIYFIIVLTNISKKHEDNNYERLFSIELISTCGTFLLPRMTDTQMNSLTPVVDGMMIYNTTHASVYARESGTWQPKMEAGVGFEPTTFRL